MGQVDKKAWSQNFGLYKEEQRDKTKKVRKED